MNRSLVVLVVGVLLAGVVAFLVGAPSSGEGIRRVPPEPEAAPTSQRWEAALLTVGGLVAVVGVVGVLGRWYMGAGVPQLIPGGVVVLAGLAVATASWSVVLGLAGLLAVGVAFLRPPPAQPPGAGEPAEPGAAADPAS